MAIEWNDTLILGIEEIDNQHQKLIEVVNKIEYAIENKQEIDIIEDIMTELIEYGTVHFQTDELYFEKFNFYDKVNHCDNHAKFFEEVANILPHLHNNDKKHLRFLNNYLRDWIKNHICLDDRKYVELFKANNVK